MRGKSRFIYEAFLNTPYHWIVGSRHRKEQTARLKLRQADMFG